MTTQAPTTAIQKADAPAKGIFAVKKYLNQQAVTDALVRATKLIKPEHMIQTALSAAIKNPRLAECSPASIAASLIQAAQLNLDVDGFLGHAYLVPYWNKDKGEFQAQLQVGYKGMLNLVFNSDKVVSVHAHVVMEGEEFEVLYGLKDDIRHVRDLNIDTNWEKAVAAYAVATFKDPAVPPRFECMSRKEVEAIRLRSKGKDSGPWKSDPVEMAKKTVVRRLCKMLPMSVEDQRALARMDEIEHPEVAQDFDPKTGEVYPAAQVMDTDAVLADMAASASQDSA